MAGKSKLIIKPKKYRGTTAVVSARLPADMIRDLDQVADSTGYNRNEVISICLEYALDEMDTGGEE